VAGTFDGKNKNKNILALAGVLNLNFEKLGAQHSRYILLQT